MTALTHDDVPPYWIIETSSALRLDGWRLSINLRGEQEVPPNHHGKCPIDATLGWELFPVGELASVMQKVGVKFATAGGPKLPGTEIDIRRGPYTEAKALEAWIQKHWSPGATPPTRPFGAHIPAKPQPAAAPPSVFLRGPRLVEAMVQADAIVPVPPWFPGTSLAWRALADVTLGRPA